MPCDSSYMAPTPGEHQRTNVLNADLKALADRLTHSCDVLREFILDEDANSNNFTSVLKHVNRDHTRDFENLVKQAKGLYVSADNNLIDHVGELVSNYRWLNDQVVNLPDSVRSKSTMDTIRKQQIEHREEDLRRLMKTLADTGDRVRLRKVLDADATKPLKPQLGFDPDEY